MSKIAHTNHSTHVSYLSSGSPPPLPHVSINTSRTPQILHLFSPLTIPSFLFLSLWKNMESMPVNWEALDSLVIDFAKSENLFEDSSSSSSSPSSSSYKSRILIRQIRRLIEIGQIDAGIDLLRLHAPPILEDRRLLFRLQKQVSLSLSRSLSALSFQI